MTGTLVGGSHLGALQGLTDEPSRQRSPLIPTGGVAFTYACKGVFDQAFQMLGTRLPATLCAGPQTGHFCANALLSASACYMTGTRARHDTSRRWAPKSQHGYFRDATARRLTPSGCAVRPKDGGNL